MLRKERPEEERPQRAEQAGPDVVDVLDPEDGNAHQEIPHGAAAQGRDQPEHERAEDVEAAPSHHQDPRDGEDRGPQHLEVVEPHQGALSADITAKVRVVTGRTQITLAPVRLV